MTRLLIAAALAFGLLAVPAVAAAQAPPAPIEPQIAADGITSGVITSIRVDQNSRLLGFVLSTRDGELIDVGVNDGTRFGLDNAAGDRWVATFSDDPTEARERIREQRERFAAVTITVKDGVASTVVDLEKGDLEQNLGFLFAVYIVTWAGFFAYIFIVSRRQRDLSREIRVLQGQVSANVAPEAV